MLIKSRILTSGFAIIALTVLLSLKKENSRAQNFTKWANLQDALPQTQLNAAPLLLHFYADSSESCQMMLDSVYNNIGIAGYVKDFAIAVRFNIYSKDTVNYLDKIYIPKSSGTEIHPFARLFKENINELPLTVILSDYDKKSNNYKLQLVKSGYISPRNFQPLIVYPVEQVSKNCSLIDFSQAFDNCFYDSITANASRNVKWLAPAEGFQTSSFGKKTLVFLYTDYCTSCTVMKRAVFPDSNVQEKTDAYFKLIEFNTEISDTIYFDNQVSVKTGKNHQLAMALLKENFFIPAISIVDENNMLIAVLTRFIPANFLVDILEYYGGNHYKTKTWEEFIQEEN
jgi:thioredoxin-related protein